MKKVVLDLNFADDKTKSKAMKKVSSLAGVESISIGKDKKMTVIGDIDPVLVVSKLQKLCCTNIVSVGPNETEKTKEGDNKQKDNNAAAAKAAPPPVMGLYYYPPPYYYPPSPYYRPVVDEDPNRCVIC